MCAIPALAQEEKWGMNNPYIDNQLLHWGFQIGINFGSFLTDQAPANVSSPGFGFRVGLLGEIKLCKYLSLRFTPCMEFSFRNMSFKSDKHIERLDAMPIILPLHFKFTSEREGNFRPYVIVGGGGSFNILRYEPEKVNIGLQIYDYFCEAGFGCDLYFRWFKWCPEITYRVGFADQIDHNFKPNTSSGTKYMDVFGTSRVINQAICLTFNFQD